MPRIPLWIFILIALLHFSAIRIDVMDVDASQYAEMSREMLSSSNYLQLYDRGADYLDKPPFLIWISAASMKLLGTGNAGYKFPSILFALWALYATYRLGRSLYDENTGRLAALILGVCQGMFLMTNDIRTDTILMSWVITAIWMIREADLKRRWYYIAGGAASIAFGMMTKGPVALLVPVFCFGTDWVLKREWKKIFNPLHLVYLLLIALLLIPMSIGLYQQFDMQPGKWVHDKQGVSGLKFFYWTQSFGRITGESSWNNGAGIGFLLQNMLWSFLPWIFLFIPALILRVRDLFRQRFRLNREQEWITAGGFILGYLALGSSKYQLPHYIFVVFPLAAIITASFIRDRLSGGRQIRLFRIMMPAQHVIAALLLTGILLILTVTFPAGPAGLLAWTAAIVIWILIILKTRGPVRFIYSSAAAMILVNIFLTHYFYPTLLNYQAGSQAGRHIRTAGINPENVRHLAVNDPLNSLHFYAGGIIRTADITNPELKPGEYILTQEEGVEKIRSLGYGIEPVFEGKRFKVSELKPAFLNHRTREGVLDDYYLIRIKE